MESNSIKFRNLRKEEIECRIGSLFTRNGRVWGEILLYQDARAAQRILDEVFGYNWQNTFKEVNGQTVCTIRVWNETRGEWVTRENVGSETTIEAAKGCFSDAFKRAASTLGIGRSLYSAPTVEVPLKEELEYYFDKATGKPKRSYNFSMRVAQIDYDKETDDIVRLILVDNDSIRFDWSRPAFLSTEELKKMKDNTQTASAEVNAPKPDEAPAAAAQQQAEKTVAEEKKTRTPRAAKKTEKPAEEPVQQAVQSPAVQPAQPATAEPVKITPQIITGQTNPEGKPVLSPSHEKWGKGIVQVAKMDPSTSLLDIYVKVTTKFFITAQDFRTLLVAAGKLDRNISDTEYEKLFNTVKAAAAAA